MEIYWSGATRYHDWKKNDFAIPATLIGQLSDAGLLGNLEWVQTGMHNKKEIINVKGEDLIHYLNFKPKRNDLYIIDAGGIKPFKWKITLALFPFIKEDQMVRGYNIINFWFEKDNLLTVQGSNSLFALFKEMHTANNTEFAFIHPYDRWFELNDPFHGAYGRPVTFDPMFTGISWATFLGQGQLELFDQSKITDIQAFEIDHTNENALYIRTTNNIIDVLKKTEEEKMFRLTEQFRSALF